MARNRALSLSHFRAQTSGQTAVFALPADRFKLQIHSLFLNAFLLEWFQALCTFLGTVPGIDSLEALKKSAELVEFSKRNKLLSTRKCLRNAETNNPSFRSAYAPMEAEMDRFLQGIKTSRQP